MTLPEPLAAELAELMPALLAGSLTESQSVRLRDVVRDDAAARRFYLEYLSTHALLQHQFGQPLAAPQITPPMARLLPRPAQAAPMPRSGRRVWYVAALMLLGVGLFVIFVANSNTEPKKSVPGAKPSVALLTDLSADAHIADDAVNLGASLYTGVFNLSQGKAQLMFTSGAVVDLTGPCSLEMINAGEARLLSGSLSALVPARARGFTVTGPDGVRVIDLGTQFNMLIDAAGRTIVHTREGHVRMERADQPPLNLAAAYSGAYEPGASRLGPIAFDLASPIPIRYEDRLAAHFDDPSGPTVMKMLDRLRSISQGVTLVQVADPKLDARGLAVNWTAHSTFARMSDAFDAVDLNAVGATLRASLRFRIEPGSYELREEFTNGLRMGLFDSAGTDVPTDDVGYHIAFQFDGGSRGPTAVLYHEPAGDMPLGGSISGVVLDRHAPTPIVDGLPHQMALVLERVPAGVRTIGLLDNRIILDHVDASDEVFAHFDRVYLGLGNLTGSLFIDDLIVSAAAPAEASDSQTTLLRRTSHDPQPQ
ncbi:MAG: hypothetical protein GC162_18755 [Planctomycetes bacterium]|nr:hypothetical protein [Planctomycetota bacterium]